MTAGYKKPHISMNRPKYGNKVKPVKTRMKKVKLAKPSILALKKIYTRISKAATWQRADLMAEAIQWYRSALRYIEDTNVQKNLSYSGTVAKQLLEFNSALGKQEFVTALKAAQYVCAASGIKTPSVQTYLQKGKVVAKKIDAKEKDLSARHDKLLTIFMRAFGDTLTLKVSPTLSIPRKFDHALNTMYFSVDHIRKLALRFKREGLLPIVIDEAWYTARARAFLKQEKDTDRFIVDENKYPTIYKRILHEFVIWAALTNKSHKLLVKYQITTNKKPKKLAA